jgi:hypothetical protein
MLAPSDTMIGSIGFAVNSDRGIKIGFPRNLAKLRGFARLGACPAHQTLSVNGVKGASRPRCFDLAAKPLPVTILMSPMSLMINIPDRGSGSAATCEEDGDAGQ